MSESWWKKHRALLGKVGFTAASIGAIWYMYGAEEHETIPGPHDIMTERTRWHPFFGNLIDLARTFEARLQMERGTETFALNDFRPFATSLPGTIVINIADPQSADQLFREEFKLAEKRGYIQDMFSDLFGKGIFVSDGDVWKEHRKTASNLVKLRTLRYKMFGVFEETCDVFSDKLWEFANDTEFDIQDLFLRNTLDSFVKIAFGVSIGSTEAFPGELEFATAFDNFQTICANRSADVLWKIKRILNIGSERELNRCRIKIDEFCDRVIEERQKHRSSRNLLEGMSNGNPEMEDEEEFQPEFKDLIDWFLHRSDRKVSKDELRDIAINFIIAGRDTTALLCTWFIYEMIKNPHICERVVEEMDQIKEVTDKAMEQELPYTTACLWETLRLHPVVPFLVRAATQDIQLKAYPEHIIRKGQVICIVAFAMGKNPNIWDFENGCDEFDPMRFLKMEGGKFKVVERPPHVLPVFNIAPRLCLGKRLALLEARIILYRLLSQFEVRATQESLDRVQVKLSVVTKMELGLRVTVVPREKE